jgi:hypothetical protein
MLKMGEENQKFCWNLNFPTSSPAGLLGYSQTNWEIRRLAAFWVIFRGIFVS